MPRQPIDILHACLTNQYVILAVAFVLFLLLIFLVDFPAGEIGLSWI
jgi:hypothetical protein